MAIAHGAYLGGAGRGVYGHVLHRNAATNEAFLPYPMFDALCLMAPMVDDRGQLFEHGTHDGPELTAKMLAAPDPSAYWVVMDEQLWTGPAADAGPYHASVNPAIEERGGRVERAPTLEGLGEACGMDPAAFVSSVERHNAGGATKIEAPPFYCVPVSPGITFTFPGIAINEKTEVLRESDGVIPGLYAAGCSTGGIHGRAGGGGYMGGLGIALITGKVAAESAAAYARP